MDRITVRGKGRNVYLTGYADVCWGGRPVGARAFCAGCHGAKDNRDVDRSKCGPLTLIDRLAAYEDAMPLERAQELAQAEKDGRLAVPPPNDPLTLEQLREMDGEPVWVETTDIKKANRWAFVDVGSEVVRFFDTRCGVKCPVMGNLFRTYGKTWFAYRRKPEEGTA